MATTRVRPCCNNNNNTITWVACTPPLLVDRGTARGLLNVYPAVKAGGGSQYHTTELKLSCDSTYRPAGALPALVNCELYLSGRSPVLLRGTMPAWPWPPEGQMDFTALVLQVSTNCNTRPPCQSPIWRRGPYACAGVRESSVTKQGKVL